MLEDVKKGSNQVTSKTYFYRFIEAVASGSIKKNSIRFEKEDIIITFITNK